MLILAGGDAHFPHEEPKLVTQFIRAARLEKPDVVVLMGDMMDFARLHKNMQLMRTPDPWKEILRGRRFFTRLREACDCPIYWIEGNHDSRPSKTLARKVPEMMEFQAMTTPELFRLDRLDINWVGENEPSLELDGFLYVHGTLVRKWGGQTAIQHLLKYHKNIVVGHCHRMAQVSIKIWDGLIIGVEAGCLCSPEAAKYYMKQPDWHQGYVFIDDGTPTLIRYGS